MAKKSKNRNKRQRITPQRNTRFAKARRTSLRFSQYKPIEFGPIKEKPKPKPVRRVRPQRTEKPQQGIKRLTPTLAVVNTDNKRSRICKRRHERNEIIHALGKAGSGGQKKPDNKNRNVQC
jgi:hypothetical protein